ELVEKLEEVAHLAGAGGELARGRQLQPVVVALGERVGAAGLAALEAASLHVRLREASRAVLAREGLESSVVVDADVPEPHGALRAGEPLVGEVLVLSTDVAAGVAMEEILLGGVDAAALRAGLHEQQLARRARRAGVHPLDEARGLQQPAAAQPLEHEEAVLAGTPQRIRQRVAVDPLVAPIGNRCENLFG